MKTKEIILHETNNKILKAIATKVKNKEEVTLTFELIDKNDNTILKSNYLTEFLFVFKND